MERSREMLHEAISAEAKETHRLTTANKALAQRIEDFDIEAQAAFLRACAECGAMKESNELITSLEAKLKATTAVMAEARVVVDANDRRAHNLGVYILHLEDALAALDKGVG